jgi:deoxyuridine 5'-triphosphate nucleotidohydrolase
MNETISFVKTNDSAILPRKNNESDSGYDIYCVEDKTVPAKGSAVVDVGLKFAYIPKNYWIKVESRSGLGFKFGILAHPGIIDNGYRGDAGIKLYNLTEADYIVRKGDRIAQFVLYPLAPNFIVDFTDKAVESSRGEKGFGSSGK